jgi:hypothetical protein
VKNKKGKPEAFIKINFLDFEKGNNFYTFIEIRVKNTKTSERLSIIENKITFGITGFKNNGILDGVLVLSNSKKKNEKKFKIMLYKNCVNIVNMNINKNNAKYYSAEIIFYFKNSLNDIILNKNYEFNFQNTSKRCRLLIYNSSELELSKFVEDYIKNEDLKNKALIEIRNNHNKLLLINFYIDTNKRNILIFIEDDKQLIIPNNQERNFFAKFFKELSYTNYNYSFDFVNIAEKYKKDLLTKQMIFGQTIKNLDNDKDLNAYLSFINQGINSLLDNNIIQITKNNYNDVNFIFGYILFYPYIAKYQNYKALIVNFFYIINNSKTKCSLIDLIRIGVSYTFFATNNILINKIQFRDYLPEDSHYLKGFKFFESIISDLNEESDLMFIYLQLNSGCGLELINKVRCFKISMLPIEEIKYHIIKNIPNYFFTFSSQIQDYVMTDGRTQVMIFNENLILDNDTKNRKNNNIMNITISMFHESGHMKFHMNNKIGADRSPLFCMNKNFELIKKIHWNNPNRGESGKFIDYYLYNSSDDTIPLDLIKSLRSNELMKKDYFIGDLKELNNKSKDIVINTIKKRVLTQKNNPNNISNLSSLSSQSKENISSVNERFKNLEAIGADVNFLKNK